MLTNPNTLGTVRGGDRRDRRGGPRGRRAALLRRREPERDPRRRAPRRHGLRHRAPEPAQDVRDPARRRRAGRRSGRGVRAAGRLPPGPATRAHRGRRRSTGRRRRARSAASTPGTATRSCSPAPTPTCGSTARTVCDAWRSAPSSTPTGSACGSSPTYPAAFDRPCMHEVVLTATKLKRETTVRALDVGKRLLEEGFHAPTVYFPLVVDEALMVEPTETESPQTLVALAEAFERIAATAAADPDARARGAAVDARAPARRGARGTPRRSRPRTTGPADRGARRAGQGRSGRRHRWFPPRSAASTRLGGPRVTAGWRAAGSRWRKRTTGEQDGATGDRVGRHVGVEGGP